MRALRTYFLCILSIGFICVYGSSGPDGKFEEWRKVTLDELQMKECSLPSIFKVSNKYYDML